MSRYLSVFAVIVAIALLSNALVKTAEDAASQPTPPTPVVQKAPEPPKPGEADWVPENGYQKVAWQLSRKEWETIVVPRTYYCSCCRRENWAPALLYLYPKGTTEFSGLPEQIVDMGTKHRHNHYHHWQQFESDAVALGKKRSAALHIVKAPDGQKMGSYPTIEGWHIRVKLKFHEGAASEDFIAPRTCRGCYLTPVVAALPQ